MTLQEQIAQHRAQNSQTGSLQQSIAQHRAAAQPPVEREPEPLEKGDWLDEAGKGLVTSGMGTYLGVKDLFTDVSDAEKETLADWKADSSDSGWATAGEVVGDIAQLALPGGVLTKAAKAAGAIRGAGALGRATTMSAPVVGDVAASAALGAAKMPDEGKTRSERAMSDAGGAMGGHYLGKALGRLGKGIKKSPEAQKLLDEGVYLTPGHASANEALRDLENVTRFVPFIAKGTQKAQKRSLKEWNKNILNKAAPEGTDVTDVGFEGFKQLKQGVNNAYDKAWSAAGKVPKDATRKMENDIIDVLDEFDTADAGVLNRVWKNIENLTDEGSDKQLKALDNMLRKEIKKSKTSPSNLGETLKDLRTTLRKGLPDDVQKGLLAVDKKYPAYLAVKKAVHKSRKNAGEFTPNQLATDAGIVGGETLGATGEAALLKQAVEAEKLVGTPKHGELVGLLRRIASIAPTPLPLQTMGNMVLGQTMPQKGATAAARKVAETAVGKALREYASGARIGSAYINSGSD